MATIKKPAMKKAAPKKTKGPSTQQQAMMQQAMAQQQAPQGQPMMKKGGKINKAQSGQNVATGVVISKKDEKANPKDFTYLRSTEKNASNKTTKPKPKAQSGTKLGKALPPPYKSGGKMKKCMTGCK